MYLHHLDSSLGMRDSIHHYWEHYWQTTLRCQPPTRIASAEDSLHTQDHHLTRAAHIQWTVDVVVMKALLLCPSGMVLKDYQLQSSLYVDWGFHWECIIIQLLSLPNPASSPSLPQLLMAKALPNKLQACSSPLSQLPGQVKLWWCLITILPKNSLHPGVYLPLPDAESW